MFETQMITTTRVWERKLEIEAERGASQHYVNSLAAPQDIRQERKSIFARLFKAPARTPQPINDCFSPEPSRGMQPG